MEQIIALTVAIIVTIIGALPFGLVNLTVLHTALHSGRIPAMRIASGAAVVEMFFGLLAILTGGAIRQHTDSNIYIDLATIAILALAGGYFWYRKEKPKVTKRTAVKGFITGVILNLVSIQVLIYWLFAIALVLSQNLLTICTMNLIFFLVGIWLGKMITLWFYAWLSNRIIARLGFVAARINRVIGIIMLLIATAQAIKIFVQV